MQSMHFVSQHPYSFLIPPSGKRIGSMQAHAMQGTDDILELLVSPFLNQFQNGLAD